MQYAVCNVLSTSSEQCAESLSTPHRAFHIQKSIVVEQSPYVQSFLIQGGSFTPIPSPTWGRVVLCRVVECSVVLCRGVLCCVGTCSLVWRRVVLCRGMLYCVGACNVVWGHVELCRGV